MSQMVDSSPRRLRLHAGAWRRMAWKAMSLLVILAMLLPNFTFLVEDARAAAVPAVTELHRQDHGFWKAWGQSPEATPTPTPTGTPTLTSTPTLEPTGTFIPTQTSAPTETPPLEPTATLTPTLTATSTSLPTLEPTVAPTITPTVTTEPTATPAPTEAVSSTLAVLLSANPAFITPGGQAFIDYEIQGWELLTGTTDLNLVFGLPYGFEPHPDQLGTYDPISNTLQIDLDSAGGRTHWVVSETFAGPYQIFADLYAQDERLASTTFQLQEQTTFVIAQSGGSAIGLQGRVKVTFPEGALDEDIDLEIGRFSPDQEGNPSHSQSGDPFELNAKGRSSQQVIHQFDEDVLIEVSYAEGLPFTDSNGLAVFYYDETEDNWQALPSEIDEEAQVVRAWTSHFSFYDIGIEDWQASRLPSLENFQVSQFTGAASYAMNFWVPPGAGGLQPSLTLSYNSQTIDNATFSSQASWVGMGWSLDLGYVERLMNGTLDSGQDDIFTLSLNGVGSKLVPITPNGSGATSVEYRTMDETFMKIIEYRKTYSDVSKRDTWEIWDKVGNRYFFTHQAQYPEYNICDYNFDRTWRWSLTKVRNVFGQELVYNYTVDNDSDKKSGCGDPHESDIAVYPTSIIYPNNKYKIVFVLAARDDYYAEWDDENNRTFFQRRRLDRIAIQHNNNGTWETVHKYQFIYATDAADHVFPARSWNSSGTRTLTLLRVEEYGFNNPVPLPATTFEYDDLHLAQAANGYGGEVEFAYGTPWYETSEIDNRKYFKDGCEYYTSQQAWVAQMTPYNGGSVDCHKNANGQTKLYLTGQAYLEIPGNLLSMLQPGGAYLVRAEVGIDTASTQVKIGVANGSTPVLAKTTTYPNTGTYTIEGFAIAPGNRASIRLHLDCDHTCRVPDLSITLQPTWYQVESKTIQDANGDSPTSTISYSYDEPATDDAAHSAAVASAENANPTDPDAELFTPRYVELRGHAAVRAVTPDGLTTTTYFHQDDFLRGRAHTTITSAEDYHYAFESTWNDTNKWSYGGAVPSLEKVAGDQALRIVNPNADWNRFVYRTGNLSAVGNTILTQFKVSGNQSQVVLAAEAPAVGDLPYLRWGVNFNGTTLQAQYNAGSGWVYPKTLFTNFERDRWYVLQLTVDADGFLMRVWLRDDPSVVGRYECSSCNVPSDRAWRFRSWVNNGTLWLDEYSESRVYAIQQTAFGAASTNIGYLPHNEQYDISKKVTVQTDLVKNMTFGGDASWVGTKTDYQYDSYGNTTKVWQASWDPAYDNGDGGWQDHHLTWMVYANPKITSDTYLVGLSSWTNTYKCAETSYNGACASGSPPASNVLSSTWVLYDNQHTDWDQTPVAGKVTGARTFIRWENPTAMTGAKYAAVNYGYDTWGNQTTVTTFTGETDYNASVGTGTTQTTTTCYETFNRDTGQCTDDGYHTYPQGVTNALDHRVKTTYDKALGVPVSVTDANGAITQAAYDAYGRLIGVCKPLDPACSSDPSVNPTIQLTYNDSATPFYTEAGQRKTGSASYLYVRKYYNGLGQLLQTQVRNATINGTTRDILTDTYYDASGRAFRQTVPYDVNPLDGFNSDAHDDYNDQDWSTTTTYDAFGRASTVRGPDGNTTTYTYDDLTTFVTDATGDNTSATTTDVWGNTVLVEPPTGPLVSYEYDANNLLLKTTYGTAVSELLYDYAGRKTQMIDADMGTWHYSYDALGNLKTQTDARSCVTTLNYDAINRLTSKTYGASNCGSGNTNVTYTYDSTGRRTGMTDASGSTDWVYDDRGRMTQETKTVSGTNGGIFITQWSYENYGVDLPQTMTYPGDSAGNPGEVVTFDYNTQLSLASLSGSSTYVSSMQYDAAGRLTQLIRGAGTLPTTYTYYGWAEKTNVYLHGTTQLIGQGGALESIVTSNNLQNLTYTYDQVGNVKTILDVTNSNQKQCFSYDTLNRLTDAAVGLDNNTCSDSIGAGEYDDETYGYDAAGRLDYKGDPNQTLSYDDNSDHVHAAIAYNGITYDYDANGNMIHRDPPGGDYYDFVYDAENRIYQAKRNGVVVATFTYDGDGTMVTKVEGNVTTIFIGNYFEIEIDPTAPPQPTLTPTPAPTATATPTPLPTFTPTPTLDPCVCPPKTIFCILPPECDNQTSSLDEPLYGSGKPRMAYASVNLPLNKHLFRGFSKLVVAAPTPPTGTIYRSYYYAGANRIALRVQKDNGSNELIYLFSDHLGSTSLTTDENGQNPIYQYYKPWGEVRPSGNNALPTDYTYTGQRRDSYINLIWMNSRWYDPALGRFTQPDTIVPISQGTQAWDRFAYVSNNPVRYTDPTGHGAYCGDDYDPGCLNEEENHLFHQLTDPVKLTKDKEFGEGYDGEMMYKLYLKYKHETNSWWYDVFGGDADGFSVEDFLVLILYHEFSNRLTHYPEDAGKYSYAISEKLSYWCAEYSSGGCGGASENAMLNYIATRGSAYKLYDHHITGGEPFRPERDGKIIKPQVWDVNLAQKVTEDALSHITPNGSLADWGNRLVDPVTQEWEFYFNFAGHAGIIK